MNKKKIIIIAACLVAAYFLPLLVMLIIEKVKFGKSGASDEGDVSGVKVPGGSVVPVPGTDTSTTVENPSGTLYLFPMQWGSGITQYCKKPTTTAGNVRVLQTICRCYSLLPASGVDGKWGNDTESAVQRLRNLQLGVGGKPTISSKPFLKHIVDVKKPLSQNSKVMVPTQADLKAIIKWHNDNVDDDTHQLIRTPIS